MHYIKSKCQLLIEIEHREAETELEWENPEDQEIEKIMKRNQR